MRVLSWKSRIAMVAWVLMGTVSQGADVGTAITYQGELVDDGEPVAAACDFEFTLWNDAAAGNQVGGVVAQTIDVTDGLFSTSLDFGVGVFTGEARWLEVNVCCASPCSPAFVTLDPRQELTPAPYALALHGLYTQGDVQGPIIIGGNSGNEVAPDAFGATISGGGVIGALNSVTGSLGSVGGGAGNTAGVQATVGGGSFNFANALHSTVGGGGSNLASAGNSTVGGGFSNAASGTSSTVPGGSLNSAGGAYSFAAGWRAKVRDADASGDSDGDEGTFAWADSTGGDFVSTGPHQFLIRAAGGVGIGTNAPANQLTVDGDADFTGNVGIATDAPQAKLHLAGGDDAAIQVGDAPQMLLRRNIANNKFEILLAGTNYTGKYLQIGRDDQTHDISLMGNVGIGTTNPAENLRVQSSDGAAAVRINGQDNAISRLTLSEDGGFGYELEYDGSDDKLRLWSRGFSGNEGVRMTWRKQGWVGIGTESPDVELDVVGDIEYTGTITDVSDERLKENIEPLLDALDKIRQLEGVTYNLKDQPPSKREAGLIAQQVQAVLPEAVQIVDPEHGYLGVSYPMLIPLLVEAVKSVDEDKDSRINELEARNGELESKNAQFEARLKRIEAMLDSVGAGQGGDK